MYYDRDDDEDADVQRAMRRLDPEDAAALAAAAEVTRLERSVFPEKTGPELAEQILQDAAPGAAHSIVRIATTDPNANVRLRASQYIIDRALGKSGQDPTKNAPWTDVFAAVTNAVEASNDARA